MGVQMKVHAAGLLDYAKAGKEAVKRIKVAMRRVLNVGRKEARQRIASEFNSRSGFLRRQSRKMQTKVIVKSYEIKGKVTPIPRLMNIFENGATVPFRNNLPKKGTAIRFLSEGEPVFYRATQINGFHLRPRPVVAPARRAMEAVAHKEFDQILREVGQ